MNQTEESIYNCYSFEGLEGWEENMAAFDLPEKKKQRYLQLIAKRREELKNGIRTEAPDGPRTEFSPRTIAERRRAKRWRPLVKTDGEGNLLIVGFQRKAGSKYANRQDKGVRVLKKPIMLQQAPKKEKT